MKLLKKIDDNILKTLLTFFVFFVPIFMKFPFQNVNFTYIAIRVDDIFSGIIIAVFALQVLRGKIRWSQLPFKKEFAAFWIVVMLSFLSGMYLTHTIDYASVGFLNAARRIQYMVLFYIAYASVQSKRDFLYFAYAFVASLLLVDIYGFGQRLLGFPAISTMNPEYSKGRILNLTPDSRLVSTFAGHYDFGAYLVFFFPFIWALFLMKKKISLRFSEVGLLFIAGLLPIMLNVFFLTNTVYQPTWAHLIPAAFGTDVFLTIIASMLTGLAVILLVRGFLQHWTFLAIVAISMLALVSTSSRTSSIAYLVSTLPFLLYIRQFRYFAFALILSSLLTFQDRDLIDRWAKTIQFKEVIINKFTGEQVVVQKIRPDSLPAGTALINKRKVTDSTASSLMKDDLFNKATMSGALDKNATAGAKAEYETYSAVAADTSLSVRFQVSWPRAIKAFLHNPVLGTGPSSLTESTDGDYFRWIGEFGALGAGLFMYLIGRIMWYLYKEQDKLSPNGKIFVSALLFGTLGLLVNAILIDVFEASKVAYLFWITLGLFVAFVQLDAHDRSEI